MTPHDAEYEAYEREAKYRHSERLGMLEVVKAQEPTPAQERMAKGDARRWMRERDKGGPLY